MTFIDLKKGKGTHVNICKWYVSIGETHVKIYNGEEFSYYNWLHKEFASNLLPLSRGNRYLLAYQG